MKKIFKKTIAFALSLALVVPIIFVSSLDARATATEAYFIFASEDWSISYWGDDAGEGITVNNATVTGEGTYTIGIAFDEPVPGTAFTAFLVKDAETLFPGAFLIVEEFRLNGEVIDFDNYFAMYEDGHTRVNLFNQWVDPDVLPADARKVGENANATPIPNDVEFSSMEVTFRVEYPRTTANIIFASGGWAASYWGGDPEGGITANNADINGFGTYTVSVDIAEPDENLAFFAVVVEDGETLFPSVFMRIDEVKFNGEAVAVGPTYSNYEDGHLRTNLFNEWAPEEPTHGITADGSTDGVSPTPVSNQTGALSSIEVTFTLMPGAVFGTTVDAADFDIDATYHAFIGGTFITEEGENDWIQFSDRSIPIKVNEPFVVALDFSPGTNMHTMADWGGYITVVETDIPNKFKDLLYAFVEYIKLDDVEIPFTQAFIEVGTGDDGVRISLTNIWSDNPMVESHRMLDKEFTRLEVSMVFVEMGTESPFGDVGLAAPEPPAAPPPPIVIEPVPEPPAVDNSGMPTWIIALIIIGAVVIVAGVILVVLKNKKK